MRRVLFLFFILINTIVSAQNKKPNILFIISDDHAYQAISAYGNKFVQTPNIDRIAREGALLTNNFVANSLCGPSRATLLTGKYSHKNGFKNNDNTVFDTHQLTFPAILQENGYQTAWIGKMHLNALPVGFDYFNILPSQGEYYNPDFINSHNDTLRYKGYITNLITDFFFNWMQQRDTTKPFMAIIGEKATHREWLPDTQDLGAYDDIDFPLPATFWDNYDTREAAKKQDMSVDKTMRLTMDLKVHGVFGTGLNDTSKEFVTKLRENYFPNASKMSDEEIKNSFRKYYPYGRMDETQAKAYTQYYDKVTEDFDTKKLTGKDLVKWKYERYMKDYYAVAKSLDRNIGRVLHYLDSTGLSKNTIVIYTSDQGFYLGEHGWFDKRFMYDESLRTAFVARYPGVIKPNTRVDHFVSNVDWAPTILDIAGVKAPAEIQGHSFLPLLKSPFIKTWKDVAYYHYYEYPQPHHVSPHFGVRTKDYMLIRFYKGTNAWELFDLKKDPNELNNVYGNAKYTAVQAKLKEQLKGLIIEYDDKEALDIFNESLPQ